ncbi:hypothetical protein AYO21_02822 [Fonsecaea monophora]|uniref:Fungal N-terminal domain-containing protein n=1 Tax=Fonsecaea monophora TaxID=254056 RepID=A0A177FGM8_9EURO|nr:hypothetical protein AYO21_02822 [Fonsecaea monophora]OAG42871.1 hypothetical protein AYO21_02822 [Fonsecaea monophora]
MSFGFSIGDIILLGQLSYKLYDTVTTGRRNASRELQELGEVLYGLNCALSHLRHVAGDISKAASTSLSNDSHGREMQQALDQMVQNCAVTLDDLDNVTKKYREGATMSENNENNEGVESGAGSGSGKSQKRRKVFKNAIASNWAKIRWDIDKDSLKAYRDKLQAHVNAINLVLSTFHWSATEKIHAHNKVQAEKIQQYHDDMVKSNSSLALLVEAMHSMMLEPTRTTPHSAPMDIENSFRGPRGLAAEPPPPPVGPKSVPSPVIRSVAAHRVPLGMCDMRSNFAGLAASSIAPGIPQHTPSLYLRAMPAVDAAATVPPPVIRHRMPPKPRKELPPEIVAINIKRQTQGAKALADLKQSLTPKPQPSFLKPVVPSVPQLLEGLEYVFSPLPRSTSPQLEAARRMRIRELELWIQSLDHLISSSAISCAPSTNKASVTVSDQCTDLVGLLSEMNKAIESSSENMRDMVYEGFLAARVDHVLDKVLTWTKSIRAQKEVEEFMEERSGWQGTH